MSQEPENIPQGFTGDKSESPDRLSDLLADRALGALSIEDGEELNRLLQSAGPGDFEVFDRIAASLELTLLTQPLEPLPAKLLHNARAAAMQELTPVSRSKVQEAPLRLPAVVATPSKPWFIRFAPTLAAAAILMIAFSMSFHPKVSPLAARQALLNSAKDVVQLAWTATEDPAARGASGDVVWSNSRQAGYMRFQGLRPNDPKQEQYQLWIFDPSQDTRYPVDGGVFNIDPSTGDAVIPITARLPLSGPTLFAVTIEKPGGVVVSDRKRLPLLAKVPVPATKGS